MSADGIKIKGYVSAIGVGAMGRRTIRFDIPEDQAGEFLAAITMHGMFVELTMVELEENAE